MQENVVASAGTGRTASVKPLGYSTTIGKTIPGLKALPVDRSHKPINEVFR